MPACRVTRLSASWPSVTSGNRCIAVRLSSVVRCVYWCETAALSCPTISRAIKSETPAAFNIVTALWRKLWNEISLVSRAWLRPLPVLLCPRGSRWTNPASKHGGLHESTGTQMSSARRLAGTFELPNRQYMTTTTYPRQFSGSHVRRNHRKCETSLNIGHYGSY